jgi:hypothetical protein
VRAEKRRPFGGSRPGEKEKLAPFGQRFIPRLRGNAPEAIQDGHGNIDPSLGFEEKSNLIATVREATGRRATFGQEASAPAQPSTRGSFVTRCEIRESLPFGLPPSAAVCRRLAPVDRKS